MKGLEQSGVKEVTIAGSGTLLSALMTPLGKCVRETVSLLSTFSKMSFLSSPFCCRWACKKREGGGVFLIM